MSTKSSGSQQKVALSTESKVSNTTRFQHTSYPGGRHRRRLGFWSTGCGARLALEWFISEADQLTCFFFRIRNLPEEGSAAKELQNKLRLFNFTCCHQCLVDLFNICQLNVYGPSHWSMQVGVVLLILYLWWNHYIITTLVKYVLGSSLIPVTLFPACYKGVIQYTNTVAKYTYPSQRQGVLYIGLCVDESELGAANSKDLSPNHPKSWFSKGIPPKCLPPP